MKPGKKRKLSNWEKFKSMIKPKSRARKAIFLAVATLAGLLIIASSVFAYADSTHQGEMFPRTVILGVDVTGLSKSEAISRVQEEALTPLKQPVTIVFRDKTWKIDPAELELQIDVPAMVEEAYARGWNRSWLERTYRRVFNRPLDINIGLSYSVNRDNFIKKLRTIAREVNQSPKDAALNFDFNTGKLTFSHSREGREVDLEAGVALLEKALLSSEQRTVELPVKITQPGLTDDDVQTVLVVDVMGNTLKWYNKDKLIKTYQVATGEPKYPTPLGKYYIIRKEREPWWINPMSEWSKPPKMPERIPPGPDNPLGTRALVTSAAGGTVLIHGTKNLIPGLYSHGCIRMANWAIEELFDHVEVGTPLFIWTSAPVPPPPPEQGPPQTPEDPGLGSNPAPNNR
jgi:hypothetical protein